MTLSTYSNLEFKYSPTNYKYFESLAYEWLKIEGVLSVFIGLSSYRIINR